uniref:Uncharacterized protein n=1 Tax=Timema douglasi TaxID=61478 RepID=A0A7R8Z4Q6_TIMDO|nr:unnamed protein product [Timema douglasi]
MISDGRSSASPTSPPYSDYHHPAHAESYQQAYQAQTQHKNPHHHTPPSSPSYANSAAQCCSLRRCCAPPQPSSHPPASRQRHRRWHGTWCCCCYCPSHAANSIFTSLGVCILVLGYTLLGAFTFMALEGEGFSKETLISANHVVTSSTSASSSATSFKSGDVGLGRDKSIALGEDIRSRTVEKLWSITEDLNILYKDNWTRLAAQEVLKFQDSLVRNLRGYGGGGAVIVKTGIAGSGNGGAIYYNHHHRWSFASSFLYSLTLITTIVNFCLFSHECALSGWTCGSSGTRT